MFKDVKEPTTYSQQVQLLRQRNVIVSNPSDCELFLSNVNYYRLSGYVLPFIDQAIDKCVVPMSFENLRAIYNFDAELRNLIALHIEKIEIYIRTQLTYFHAHHYGALGYIDSNNYNFRHNHISFMSRIQLCIDENSKSPVVVHHNNVYGGKFPLWVIIDYFSLGMLSHFYTDMKNPDKAFIAESLYGVNYQMLSSWLHCLTDLRNRCAHYSRLYYWIFSSIPKIRNAPFAPDRTLYSQLYMLKLMTPNADDWLNGFAVPLYRLIDKYSAHILLVHMGFLPTWREDFGITKKPC